MIFAVVGPTCSGKSALAIKIAQIFDAEIINFDPYQCYEELQIGVAKPSQEELEIVPHHLFSFVPLDQDFTIFDFQKVFREKVKSLQNLNKNIVLVGGSGLYLRSAIYDYEFSETKIVDETKYNSFSNEELYERLKLIDPESSEKIHMNNRKRVIRALEIFDETGSKKSDLEKEQEHKPIYDITFIGLNPDRELLYQNINLRVDIMFENGLEEEVEYLYKKYDPSLKSLQAIGYKEFTQVSRDEVRELIKKNTRNYAKRQMTFFKNQFENINWFNNKEDAIKYLEGLKRD